MNKYETLIKNANSIIQHNAYDWAEAKAETIISDFEGSLENWLKKAKEEARKEGEDTNLNINAFVIEAGESMKKTNKYLIQILKNNNIGYNKEGNYFFIITT